MSEPHEPCPGHYARKQLGARSWFVAFSHGSRFDLGRRLVEPCAGGRLLDYGCGDGTFLWRVHDLFPGAVGADLDAGQVEDCRARFSGRGLEFLTIEELANAQHQRSYDLAVCMEVLEHCRPQVVEQVLDDLARLVRPGGRVVISVPIEIGPSLIVKQVLRRVAAWRGDTAYRNRETYRPREFWRMVFAGRGTAIDRPILAAEQGGGHHGHKGFNWLALRERVRERMELLETRFSPVSWLGSWLNSQAWFVCQVRP